MDNHRSLWFVKNQVRIRKKAIEKNRRSSVKDLQETNIIYR